LVSPHKKPFYDPHSPKWKQRALRQTILVYVYDNSTSPKANGLKLEEKSRSSKFRIIQIVIHKKEQNNLNCKGDNNIISNKLMLFVAIWMRQMMQIILYSNFNEGDNLSAR
jgi:hypothetical protein